MTARNRRLADKVELLGRLYGADEPNPAPYYAWCQSMHTRVAVYKAHVASEPWPTGTDTNRMDAFNYAVRRGIVFG